MSCLLNDLLSMQIVRKWPWFVVKGCKLRSSETDLPVSILIFRWGGTNSNLALAGETILHSSRTENDGGSSARCHMKYCTESLPKSFGQ